MAYTCEKCSFVTHNKSLFARHCDTEKHKIKTAPDLAKQLANIKVEEMELKTDMKRIELERKQELKKKEHELKEKIKEDLLKTEEKMIARKTLEKALPVVTFMENVIDRPQIEDYTDIFNGAATFEDIFMRDFLAEYDNSKSVVLEKGCLTGYYMNSAPCLWYFYQNDTTGNGLTRILSLIPLYHKYLKECAKENGCNVKEFNLSMDTKKQLEDWMKEEMTFLVSTI